MIDVSCTWDGYRRKTDDMWHNVINITKKSRCFKESAGCRNNTRKLSYRKDDLAMRPMYGRPENFQESLTTPTATFPEFLMSFCSD